MSRVGLFVIDVVFAFPLRSLSPLSLSLSLSFSMFQALGNPNRLGFGFPLVRRSSATGVWACRCSCVCARIVCVCVFFLIYCSLCVLFSIFSLATFQISGRLHVYGVASLRIPKGNRNLQHGECLLCVWVQCMDSFRGPDPCTWYDLWTVSFQPSTLCWFRGLTYLWSLLKVPTQICLFIYLSIYLSINLKRFLLPKQPWHAMEKRMHLL